MSKITAENKRQIKRTKQNTGKRRLLPDGWSAAEASIRTIRTHPASPRGSPAHPVASAFCVSGRAGAVQGTAGRTPRRGVTSPGIDAVLGHAAELPIRVRPAPRPAPPPRCTRAHPGGTPESAPSQTGTGGLRRRRSRRRRRASPPAAAAAQAARSFGQSGYLVPQAPSPESVRVSRGPPRIAAAPDRGRPAGQCLAGDAPPGAAAIRGPQANTDRGMA